MSGIYCKIHSYANSYVLAACDAELIGKTLRFGEVEFHISEHFYKGELISESELAKLLEEYDNINLVGERTVSVALKKGLASEKAVLRIENVPHLQIYRLY